MPLASILIATHRRNHLLKWNLTSLVEQNNDVEVIVLDDFYQPDEECKALVNKFSAKLNIRYVHSGKTKNGQNIWRVPGFAYNIGAKLATSDILIIGCGEMYHVGNTTKFIIDKVTSDRFLQCTVSGVDDKRGVFLQTLESGGKITSEMCKNFRGSALYVHLPFFLGVSKDKFFDIGGYDESFTGIAYEDNDMISRLIRHGVKPSHTPELAPTKYKAQIQIPNDLYIIHLHSAHISGKFQPERHTINRLRKQHNEANNIIVANVGKEWGKLDNG